MGTAALPPSPPAPRLIAASRPWSLAERVGFRFVFVYALLYYPVLAVDRLPLFAWVIELWNGAWSVVAPFAARHVLGVTRPFPDTSEGLLDVRYAYVRAGCALLFAALGTVVWSLRARQARHHATLLELVRVLLRYGLANAMIAYGLGKVFEHQFEATSLALLVQPYGEQSSKDVLWNFMGSSRSYSVFCGAAECLGGVLLLWRRTATLGALVTAAAMTNVVALDLSYDVFVKLFAFHLWLMAIALASVEARPLFELLVLRRTVTPQPLRPHFSSRRWNRAAMVVKLAFVAYLAFVPLQRLRNDQRERAAEPRPALYGIWDITSCGSGDTWQRLVLDAPHGGGGGLSASLWHTDGTRERLSGSEDDARRILMLETWKEGDPPRRFTYDRDGDRLILTPEAQPAAAPITLQRRDESSFRLRRAHFRWANGDSIWREVAETSPTRAP